MGFDGIDDIDPHFQVPIDEDSIDGVPEIFHNDTVKETDDKYIVPGYRAPISRSPLPSIGDIGELTDYEEKSDLEDKIYKYEAKGQRYVPLPSENEYYDIREETFYELSKKMHTDVSTDFLDGLGRLADYPFLLYDEYGTANFKIINKSEVEDEVFDGFPPLGLDEDEYEEIDSTYEFREKYPDVLDDLHPENSRRYKIITISEINKKQTKDVVYPIFSTLPSELAELISREYPDSRSLATAVDGIAYHNWKQNQDTETEVHISEFMGLADMRDIILDSNRLQFQCGFESPEHCEQRLNRVKEFRNRVMHANKTLAHNKEELSDFISVTEDISDILEALSVASTP